MKSTNFDDNISADFTFDVQQSIRILSELSGASTDAEILVNFKKNNINYVDAKKILIFLPIAFCRRLLQDRVWDDTYYEINKEKTFSERKFSETNSYIMTWQVVDKYFSNKPISDVILKIAGRSSEFHTINELLNSGGKLEDIKLTSVYIVW